MDYGYIDDNFAKIDAKIRAAADGREMPEMIVAIKSADIDEIEYLVKKHGVHTVGENRASQLIERYEKLKGLGVDIHFIGSLQTNKVRQVIDKVKMIHSLDRISLAREINKQAQKRGIVMDVLVEINSGREESKGGVLPENVEDFCKEIAAFEHINLRGFMTMAPKCEKNSEYLKYFCETYQLVLDIWQKKLHNIDIPILSMGMSDSFEEAIASGSNMVRIGRSMFNKNSVK